MLDFRPELLPAWINVLVVLAAIVIVGKGAHWVVESAEGIAKRLGVTELVIGLTIVAMGTSAPEFAVTLMAAVRGHGDISVGNIVGSNIFNLGFILGGCALVRAIPTTADLVWRDGFVLAASTALLIPLIGLDLELSREDGMLLLVLLVFYLVYLMAKNLQMDLATRESGGPVARSDEIEAPVDGRLRGTVARLALGLVFTIGGCHVLIDAAVALALALGVGEWAIGVTVVAAGTSAPEFVVSLVGVLTGRYAISLGSLIGSDIFNVLGVLGLAGLLRPVAIDPIARLSLLALSAMVLLVLAMMRSGWRLSRWEGLILVAAAMVRWGFDLTAGTQ